MKKLLKNLQIKGFIVGVLTTTVLSSTLLVVANTSGVMRELFYGVNIVINGQAYNPPDDMQPFIMDGRTFLPVRGIAEVLDVPVVWDGSTRTVYVGTIPHGQPFLQAVPWHENHHQMRTSTVNMQGNPFPNAMNSNSIATGLSTTWSHHNLNGQHNTLTGTIGRVDGLLTNTNVPSRTISFIGDGRVLASYTIDSTTTPTDISVDVRGVLILRVEISGSGAAFANAMIQ